MSYFLKILAGATGLLAEIIIESQINVKEILQKKSYT
jgi:hypothetical protein